MAVSFIYLYDFGVWEEVLLIKSAVFVRVICTGFYLEKWLFYKLFRVTFGDLVRKS